MEGCDALVVGSPVFKASYGGLFKHVFDLIEGRLMPLFDVFGAQIALPTLYASDADFAGPDLASARVEAGIAAAAAALGRLMRG